LPLLQQNPVHKAEKKDKNHTDKNTHNAPCQKNMTTKTKKKKSNFEQNPILVS
jgi:hypothetical protein